MIERGARRFVGWAKARNAPCPRVSQNVFLKTCFSKRVSQNVFLKTCFSKRVSQNAFLKTVFLKTAWASLRSAHPTKRTKTKGSRTPTDAGLPASPSGEARTLARARSPVGVPLRLSPGRQLVPKAQRQAMLSGTVRSVRSCTAAPTGERRPCASPCMIRKSGCRFSGKIMHHSQAYPRRNKSQCSEHLTCRSLCRQADARRRPSAEGTNPLPASTGPAPASHSSLGWRPVRGAR